MNTQHIGPDIRVPAGSARPLTKSEKCSIAGRKGGTTTATRYGREYMSQIGKKGFRACIAAQGMNPDIPGNRAAYGAGFVKGGLWVQRKRGR